METNIAAWMIAGGPRLENPHAQRDREQLHALRESQRAAEPERVSLSELVGRIRELVRARSAEADPGVCADPACGAA
ncbi:MAG TPA: hypothetical protein VK194_00450 [Candidatus Deferrimicrobium sp.]|nr:hypothetical protein [Candidatus Deferrimicrobium sp.]